jgi:hypothetical protein
VSRTESVVTTAGSNIITGVGSAQVFTSGDVGATITGSGIPAGTTITSDNGYSATLSANATSTNANDSVTIGPDTSGDSSLSLAGGSPLPLSTLESAVLNPVLSQLSMVLGTLATTLGLNVAGLDVYNPAFPGTPAPPGIDCGTGYLLQ